jgi:hypothetical protein
MTSLTGSRDLGGQVNIESWLEIKQLATAGAEKLDAMII